MSLNRLLKVAGKVRQEADGLAAELEELEGMVGALNIGIEVLYKGFGYGRLQTRERRWGFFVVVDGDVRRRVIECSKNKRIEFSGIVSNIIDDLMRKANEHAKSLETARGRIATQIDRIGNSR